MTGALLDVNVLIALAWPNSEGHHAARAWFEQEAGHGWATTPVTELGFVRVSSNRRFLPTVTTPGVAVTVLERLRDLGDHRFWPDTVELVTDGEPDAGALRGNRQVTDAHLLALCHAHDGVLVTFDRGVASLPDSERCVRVLTA